MPIPSGGPPFASAEFGVAGVIRGRQPRVAERAARRARCRRIHSCLIVPLQARGANVRRHDPRLGRDGAKLRRARRGVRARHGRPRSHRARQRPALPRGRGAGAGRARSRLRRRRCLPRRPARERAHVEPRGRGGHRPCRLRMSSTAVADDAIPGWARSQRASRSSPQAVAPPRAESLPLDLGERELWLSIHGVVVAGRDRLRVPRPDRGAGARADAHGVRLDRVARAAHAARRHLRRGDDAAAKRRPARRGAARRACSTSSPARPIASPRTVNDILWASRLDTDTLRVTIQNCDPLALAADVVAGAAGAPRPPITSSC